MGRGQWVTKVLKGTAGVQGVCTGLSERVREGFLEEGIFELGVEG